MILSCVAVRRVHSSRDGRKMRLGVTSEKFHVLFCGKGVCAGSCEVLRIESAPNILELVISEDSNGTWGVTPSASPSPSLTPSPPDSTIPSPIFPSDVFTLSVDLTEFPFDKPISGWVVLGRGPNKMGKSHGIFSTKDAQKRVFALAKKESPPSSPGIEKKFPGLLVLGLVVCRASSSKANARFMETRDKFVDHLSKVGLDWVEENSMSERSQKSHPGNPQILEETAASLERAIAACRGGSCENKSDTDVSEIVALKRENSRLRDRLRNAEEQIRQIREQSDLEISSLTDALIQVRRKMEAQLRTLIEGDNEELIEAGNCSDFRLLTGPDFSP